MHHVRPHTSIIKKKKKKEPHSPINYRENILAISILKHCFHKLQKIIGTPISQLKTKAFWSGKVGQLPQPTKTTTTQ